MDFILSFISGGLTDVVTASIYVVMAIFFVICITRCIAPVFQVRRVLRRAVRSLKAGEKSRRSWQEDHFLGKGPLYPHWREYLNNLFFADGEYHNPSSVEDFINEETAIDGPGRSALSETAAGIFVSLGFLGTLLGISIGLSDFDIVDPEGMMSSIRTLVPGMKYAFTTSIVGVVMSIFFTLMLRLTDGSARHALTLFYDAMQKHAGVVSVEPMTQIAIYQQEQTALIQTIANSIDQVFRPLQKTVEDFAHIIAREQARGIDNMTAKFIERLDETMDGQLTHLTETIDTTCKEQERMYAGIGQLIDEISGLSRDTMNAHQLTGDMLKKLKEYTEGLGKSSEAAQEGYARISANVEHLEIVARQQNTYLQSVSEMQREATQSFESFRKASGRLMHSLDQNTETSAAAMKSASAAMDKSSDTLAKYQEMFVNGFNRDIDKLYNTYFSLMQEVVGQLNKSIGDLNRTVDRMPMILDETADLYDAQSGRISDALSRAQAALSDVVERLRGVDQ